MKPGKHIKLRRRAAVLAAITLAATSLSSAGRFDALLGTWSGSGRSIYQDGQSEPIRCSAFYTEGGQKLRMAIRCQSSSNAIEIRGQLTALGDAVSGTWEERTFNAAGEATGRFVGDRLTLAVKGGGFSGTMSVQLGGARQIVTIATQGISLRSVSVTLAKGR